MFILHQSWGISKIVWMKKSEQTGPTNYVDKLLAWVRKRMAELKETPDMDGKKDILQVIKR